MATVAERKPNVERQIQELIAGDFLDLDEFLRRWEAMPQLKRAELIRGVVYMPSPLGLEHGSMDMDVAGWLAIYRAATPGCQSLSNVTWLMAEDSSPQPDASLRILPEFGGQSKNQGLYAQGAPEFIAEVCVSSTSYDLHQKLDLYQESGVQEYLAVLMREQEVRWHRLTNGRFEIVPLPPDGIYRSSVFPGLWLDAQSLMTGDLAKVLAMVQAGIQSPEHKAFVEQLASKRADGA